MQNNRPPSFRSLDKYTNFVVWLQKSPVLFLRSRLRSCTHPPPQQVHRSFTASTLTVPPFTWYTPSTAEVASHVQPDPYTRAETQVSTWLDWPTLTKFQFQLPIPTPIPPTFENVPFFCPHYGFYMNKVQNLTGIDDTRASQGAICGPGNYITAVDLSAFRHK